MDFEKDEQVIYFKDLMFVALYQWRRILAFAVVFALLLGGFMGIKSWKEYASSVGTLTEAQASYQKQLKQYEAKKQTIQSEMESTVQRLEDVQKAEQESPLNVENEYSVYTAYALYTATVSQPVSSSQGVLRDDTHTVLQSYKTLLAGQTAANALAEALDFDPRYISDVLDTNYTSDARTLKVSVTYTSAEKAREGLAVLQQLLADAKDSISNSSKTHTLNLLVEDLQNISYDQLQLNKAEQEQLTRELTDHLSALEDTLAELVAPVAPEQLSKTNVLKKTVIFAVIGGVLGAFLAAAWSWLGHLAGSKVYSKRTLLGRTHIDTIAVMDDLSGNALDRWLRQLEGRAVGEESRLICNSIVQQYCANNENVQILYCGINPLEELNNALGNKALFAKADTLEAVEQLAGCDSIVLVAQCHVSRYDVLRQQAKQIAALGKKLVGCVLING